jgi:cell division protein FtsB
MQILVAALIAVLVFLQYLLWIAEDGVRQTYALRVAIQAQTEENAELNERNRALEADVKDLKSGLMAIEERARSEMGMIRRDETFYRLLEQPPKPVAPAKPSIATTKPPAQPVKPPATIAKPSPTQPAKPPAQPVKPPATIAKPSSAAPAPPRPAGSPADRAQPR